MTQPPYNSNRAERARELTPDADAAVKEEIVPSDRNNVLLLSLGAVALAVIGIVLTVLANLGWVGVVACAIGFILAVVAVVIAYGDIRASVLTPVLAGIGTLLALLVVTVYAAGVAEQVEDVDPARVIVPEAHEERQLPDDPAELAAPPEQRTADAP